MRVLLLLLCSAPLSAAPCVYAERAEADEAEALGCAKAAFDAGAHEEAIGWLKIAEGHTPRALHAYNQGRALEQMGRFAEAHTQFARALAMPDLEDEQRRLTRLKLEALEALRSEASVRLEAMLQLDGGLLPAGVHRLKPGAHTLCHASEGAVRCRAVELRAGIEQALPPPDHVETTGLVDLSALTPVESLHLGEHPVLIEGTVLRLDAGSHALQINERSLEVDAGFLDDPQGLLPIGGAGAEEPRQHLEHWL